MLCTNDSSQRILCENIARRANNKDGCTGRF
jgi:hypothetical protein